MESLSVKSFNWLRSPSMWEKTQAWRVRQQESSDSFESANTAANSSLFGASINLTNGLNAVAAKSASKRIQAQAIRAVLNKLA